MGLLWAIEMIKICFVFHTGFYSINLMSEKYGSLLQGFGKEICTHSYMYVPRQTLSIKIKKIEEQFRNKVLFLSFSAKYFDVGD